MASVPAFRSASRRSNAVELTAVQIRLPASDLSYPVIEEVLGASTCCPVWKYAVEKATSLSRSQLIVIVRTTMSTFPCWIAGMRWLVGIARNRIRSRSPRIFWAISCARSMSKPSSSLDFLFGSR